jgi:HSP20 family protein
MLARINRSNVPAYWDDFFNDSFFNGTSPAGYKNTSPAVNILESNELFRIEVAAPGITREDFNINLEDDILTISSEQKEEKEENDRRYLLREFSYNAFKRSFKLTETIDAENIKASYDSGILTIELPKKEEALPKAPRQIEVANSN